MARVGRLAGALIVESLVNGESVWFLVGDTKVPCDWEAAGFKRPEERDVQRVPWVRLSPTTPSLEGACLRIELEGEPAARCIAERLLIARTGAVSERLWRLIVGEEPSGDELDARWLGETPIHVWDVVRDAVLRCS